MIKSELIARITAQNPHLFAADVEAVVNGILDRIAGALADADRVELRDFGTFCVRDREARTARNPRTGETVVVEAKAHVHFKPGKRMRARLNLRTVTSEQDSGRILRAS
ncbi:integration host factor subunit beta [Methylobacterium longum]|uniref:Integration host factor subunit beta n=1 Tax=Methylobacterium longum TaxID=767694 RepID=A0ABT8AZU6_9HYPH|nr:integration host factor subunit beta [Methylobacterium longum]MDN3575127.1 integration host factor subunit beta [Methylobacterium longum]GJE15080.1 Integration host factor subunit beta [Methylobacterium longum]